LRAVKRALKLCKRAGGATLDYDPLGRLHQTASSANAATAGVTTRCGYDGVDLIAEYDGAGAVLRRYVRGPGSDEPLDLPRATGRHRITVPKIGDRAQK
jgi:hypothetical protein